MEPGQNPYAPPRPTPTRRATPPRERDEPPRDSAFFRAGDLLAVRAGSTLPEVCIASGDRTDVSPETRMVYHFQPWMYVLLVISRIIFVILYATEHGYERGELTYYWSSPVKQRRTLSVVVGVVVVGLCLAALGPLSEMRPPPPNWVVFALLGLIVLGIAYAIFGGRPYRVHRIEDGWIFLKVHPDYWAGLERAGVDVPTSRPIPATSC